MKQIGWVCVASMLVGAGACGDVGSKQQALMTTNMSELVTAMDALQIAQAEVPEGTVIGLELELEDDDGEDEPPVWEVDLFVPSSGELYEVEIHAITGAVLEVENETDEHDDD